MTQPTSLARFNEWYKQWSDEHLTTAPFPTLVEGMCDAWKAAVQESMDVLSDAAYATKSSISDDAINDVLEAVNQLKKA